MKIEEKIALLAQNHLKEWLAIRTIVEMEVSNNQPMLCVCGRLATGFHEMSCQRFKKKVNRETAKRLSHLL